MTTERISPERAGASIAGAKQPRPRWVDSEMQEPWHRDMLVGLTVHHSRTVDDLRRWAEGIARTYSKSGTLEVTACIWALLDALDAKGEVRDA